MKKMLLLLLSACLLLTGCGIIDLSPVSSAQPESAPSSQKDVSQEPSGTLIERNFTLCLEPGDSLNPYRCSTRTNLELAGLLYRSLVRLSPSLEPQKELAQEITLDGLTCTAVSYTHLIPCPPRRFLFPAQKGKTGGPGDCQRGELRRPQRHFSLFR